MNSEPLVTVVIATYNRAGLVPRAIESVRQQTYRNIEILVIDDGSPDDTGLIVQSIPDPRIRYIRHEANKGLPAGRNTGIRAAKGEYIAFLDDDDQWREDKLERQLKAIAGYDSVACTAVVHGYPLRIHNRPDISLDDLRRGGFAPSGLLARTHALRNVMFDESLRQGEDWDAFIRIAQRYTMGWVAEPLLMYDQGGHVRMTNEKKFLSGPELEKRTAMLHKHRSFLGERWFKYHLADTFLGYIGSRSNKLHCIGYAVKQCGVAPVLAVFRDKVREKLRRVVWIWRSKFSPAIGR
jgi:glycosyltransferase involved in cell wall biosynthesis